MEERAHRQSVQCCEGGGGGGRDVGGGGWEGGDGSGGHDGDGGGGGRRGGGSGHGGCSGLWTAVVDVVEEAEASSAAGHAECERRQLRDQSNNGCFP